MVFYNFKNHIISGYLFYLIPLGLVSGPFLPDLFLTIIGISFLIKCIIDRNFNPFKITLSKYFFLFYVTLLSSSVISNFPLFSLESSFFYIRYLLYFVAIYYLCSKNPSIINNFLNILLITVIIVVFDGYFEFFFNHNILGSSSPDPSRILSFFHAMIIGSFLSKILPLIFLYLTFKELNKTKIILIYYFICLIYVLIFLSGERSAFLHASIIFIFLSITISHLRKLFFISSTLILILLSMVMITNDTIKDRMFTSVIDGFNIKSQNINLTDDQKIIFFSPAHDRYIRVAYQIFLDNKLLGSGPNTFRKECSYYSEKLFNNTSGCNTHPHNTYAQLLAETGVIGFSLLISLFFYIVILLFKNLKAKNLDDHYRYSKICLLTYFFIILFPLTPTGNFFNNWIGAIYFLPVGIYLSSLVNYEKK
tara:strand:+ start:5043 stop:6308 length:1266 start_codon:yes stop_codon:yes gene_type:complete